MHLPPTVVDRAHPTPSGFWIVALTLLLSATGCGGTGGRVDGETGDPAVRSRPEAPPFFLGGIQVHEADQRVWLDNIEARSMNTLSVTDYALQGDWDSDDLRWDEDDSGMLGEVREAKERGLHVVLILRVAMDHAFERNEFLWHGMIAPSGDEALASWFEKYTRFVVRWARIAEAEGVDALMIGSELNALASTVPLAEIPSLEEYFLNDDKQARRKAEMLNHAGQVAERHLASEERADYPDLESYLEARIAQEQDWARRTTGSGTDSLAEINRRRKLLEQHWIALIGAVREVYTGPVGYAANFDQYHEVGFWEHLDVMGINAYFKLRDHLLEPGQDRGDLEPLLTDGWRRVLAEIHSFRQREGVTDRPVIFTEMGYTFRANSTLQPWAHEGFALFKVGAHPAEGPDSRREQMVVWTEQPDDLEERALAVRALHTAHRELGAPFLRGILWWKLSSHDYHRDVESFLLWIGEDSQDPLFDSLQLFFDQPSTGAPRVAGPTSDREPEP